MARQRIHNRRAARGSLGGGASWISYSDMMAALLLIFVLILAYSLHQYFKMLEIKTQELDAKEQQLIVIQTDLDAKEKQLIIIQADLDAKTLELEDQKIQLNLAQTELNNKEQTLIILQDTLNTKEEELKAANLILLSRQQEVENLQNALNSQALQIDAMIGIRAAMIRELSSSLSSANLKASVDPNTGDIMLDSSVFFESGKSSIKQEGKDLLDRFIPVYLEVLLRPEYYPRYLGEIIIEGHTDSTGSYETNLKLSQDRALQVALYCLNMPSLSAEQKEMLKQILTAKGRSYSDLIYYEGTNIENPDASRRVEFKFSLRDSEMIEQMKQILDSQEE